MLEQRSDAMSRDWQCHCVANEGCIANEPCEPGGPPPRPGSRTTRLARTWFIRSAGINKRRHARVGAQLRYRRESLPSGWAGLWIVQRVDNRHRRCGGLHGAARHAGAKRAGVGGGWDRAGWRAGWAGRSAGLRILEGQLRQHVRRRRRRGGGRLGCRSFHRRAARGYRRARAELIAAACIGDFGPHPSPLPPVEGARASRAASHDGWRRSEGRWLVT